MGKRRAASSKAPRTPVQRRTKQTEVVKNEVAVTPTRDLAIMGLSKEELFMCSQSQTNSQIDVKWDCNSPDALRQIQLTRAKRLHGDPLDDLVLKLANEIPVEEERNSTPPLLGLWVNSKEEPDHRARTSHGNQKLRRSERRKRSGRPSADMKFSVDAKELVLQLELALHKHRECDKVEETASRDEQNNRYISPEPVPLEEIQSTSRPSRSNNADACTLDLHLPDLSRDLFESMDVKANQKDVYSNRDRPAGQALNADNKTSGQVGHCESIDNKRIIVCSSPAHLETVTEENEVWSDDDLFADVDDSLILKAELAQTTQPTPSRTTRLSKRKSSLTSPSEPQMKTKRYTFSLNESINPKYHRPVPPTANGTNQRIGGVGQMVSRSITGLKAELAQGTNRLGTSSQTDIARPCTSSNIGHSVSAGRNINSNIVNNSHRSEPNLVALGNRPEAYRFTSVKYQPGVISSSSAQMSVPVASHTIPVAKTITVPNNSTGYHHGTSASNSSSNRCGQIFSSQSSRNVAPSPAWTFKRHNTFPCPSKERTNLNSGTGTLPSQNNRTVQQNNTVRNELFTGTGRHFNGSNNNSYVKCDTNNKSANRPDVSSSIIGPSQNAGLCSRRPQSAVKTGQVPGNSPKSSNLRADVPSSQNNSVQHPVRQNVLSRNKLSTVSGRPHVNINNSQSESGSLKFLAPTCCKPNPNLCKKNPQNLSKSVAPVLNIPKTAIPGTNVQPKPNSSISPAVRQFSTKASDFATSPAGRTRNSKRSIGLSSLNNSLSDDLLCQLAEPDDLLDSQTDFCPPEPSQVEGRREILDQQLGVVADEIAKLDMLKKPLPSPNKHPKPATGKTVYSFSNAPKLSDFQKPAVQKSKPEQERCKYSSVGTKVNIPNRNGTGRQWTAQKPVSTNFNASQFPKSSQPGKYHFKSARSNSGGSNNSGSSNSSAVSRRKPPTSSTSSNSAGTSNKQAVHTTGKSELDDSFLNEDDDLSTPQMLAMLDEVETQVSQPSVVFKCTPDEIEKKKKAALERRLKNQQQQKRKPVLRPSTRQYKPLF